MKKLAQKMNFEALKKQKPYTFRIYDATLNYLWIDIAFSQIDMIIVDILCPVTSKLGNTYLQPWLHVPIVVHNSSTLDIFVVDVGIVAKTQDMPRSVQWESTFPECYETWWQCS
jgi:hypothetical protein